jgi:hypothetical protein
MNAYPLLFHNEKLNITYNTIWVQDLAPSTTFVLFFFLFLFIGSFLPPAPTPSLTPTPPPPAPPHPLNTQQKLFCPYL